MPARAASSGGPGAEATGGSAAGDRPGRELLYPVATVILGAHTLFNIWVRDK